MIGQQIMDKQIKTLVGGPSFVLEHAVCSKTHRHIFVVFYEAEDNPDNTKLQKMKIITAF